MTKKEFLQELNEIVSDSLFIGENELDLQKEINNNEWCISANSELAKILTIEDLSVFIEQVILNRKEQVKTKKTVTNLLFYLWFDEQTSQIRFNIISDYGKGLPFGCKVIPMSDYTSIVKAFLEHPYHDGIPLEDLVDVDFDKGEELNIQDYSIEVYCVEL